MGVHPRNSTQVQTHGHIWKASPFPKPMIFVKEETYHMDLPAIQDGKWRFRARFPTKNVIVILVVTGILGGGDRSNIPCIGSCLNTVYSGEWSCFFLARAPTKVVNIIFPTVFHGFGRPQINPNHISTCTNHTYIYMHRWHLCISKYTYISIICSYVYEMARGDIFLAKCWAANGKDFVNSFSWITSGLIRCSDCTGFVIPALFKVIFLPW